MRLEHKENRQMLVGFCFWTLPSQMQLLQSSYKYRQVAFHNHVHIFKLKYITCRAAQYEATWSNAPIAATRRNRPASWGAGTAVSRLSCGLLSGATDGPVAWPAVSDLGINGAYRNRAARGKARNLQPHIWSSLHIFSSFETMPHSWAAAAFSAGTSNKLLTYVSSSFVADKTAVLSFPSLPRKLEGWEQNQFQGRWVAFEHWEGVSQRKTKLNFFESFGGRCTDWFNYQRINGFKTGAAGSEAHRPNPTCWEPVGCTFPPESRQIWWIEMAHMQISRPSPLEFPLGNGDPGPRHFLESWILWVAHLWPNAFFRHIGRYLTWSGGSAGFHFLEFRVIIWDHL